MNPLDAMHHIILAHLMVLNQTPQTPSKKVTPAYGAHIAHQTHHKPAKHMKTAPRLKKHR